MRSAEQVLEAHKLLVQLNPKNSSEFTDLIRALEIRALRRVDQQFLSRSNYLAISGGYFALHKFTVTQMQQISHTANNTFLMLIQMAVSKGDTPHRRH